MSKPQNDIPKAKFSISALFRSNRFVAIFALVVSVSVWFAVSISFNPIVEKTIINVPIHIPQTTNANSELKPYEGADTTVAVKVSGKKYIVDQLTPDDLTVTASMNNVLGVGTFSLDLAAKGNAGLTDFDVISVSPPTVSVTFDNEAEKTFDISVALYGATADGDYGPDSILVVEPEIMDENQKTITVKGAASQVKQIDRVVAMAELNETLRESKQVSARIMMYNMYDELLFDSSNVEESAISLTDLPFSEINLLAQVNMVRDVPIKVSYKNAPQTLPNIAIYEKSLTDSSLTPVSSLRIKGPAETVANINEITLDGNFDFLNLNPDQSDAWYKDMYLPVLSGVSYSDYANVKDAVFRVAVDPTDLAVKSYDLTENNIVVANSTYAVSVESVLKGIRVIGPPVALRSLAAEEIIATLDASNLTPGTYTLKPTFSIPAKGQCWVSGNYEVTIRIS